MIDPLTLLVVDNAGSLLKCPLDQRKGLGEIVNQMLLVTCLSAFGKASGYIALAFRVRAKLACLQGDS